MKNDDSDDLHNKFRSLSPTSEQMAAWKQAVSAEVVLNGAPVRPKESQRASFQWHQLVAAVFAGFLVGYLVFGAGLVQWNGRSLDGAGMFANNSFVRSAANISFVRSAANISLDRSADQTFENSSENATIETIYIKRD